MTLTYQEKELQILREAVDKAEEITAKNLVQSETVKNIINIVENFLIKKKCVCYGGTAINNILPVQDQFYNKDLEIPDYDFFSDNALKHAKELADIYYDNGYSDVEAKAGVHHGTYKVFVNFIPVADITQLDKELFKAISKEAIQVNGILYAPPNYLRMSMYLELSRPKGDVSRWEKVLKRLILLNKHYPIKNIEKCNTLTFMRDFENININEKKNIYNTVKNAIIDQGLVFFGGYASSLYGKYMPKKLKKMIISIPDFDVLSTDPEHSAIIISERLKQEGFNSKITKRPGIGEIIAPHYEISIDKDTVAFIYEPLACHSYNTIKISNKIIKIATIDTMLSFYLAFIYANRPYYDYDRLQCMSQYLFQVQAKNRLQQKGLLKRFSLNCYGQQQTLENMRAEKTDKFKELKNNKSSKEYQEWFLRYLPNQLNSPNENKKKTKKQTKKQTKKRTRKQTKKKTKKEYWNL